MYDAAPQRRQQLLLLTPPQRRSAGDSGQAGPVSGVGRAGGPGPAGQTGRAGEADRAHSPGPSPSSCRCCCCWRPATAVSTPNAPDGEGAGRGGGRLGLVARTASPCTDPLDRSGRAGPSCGSRRIRTLRRLARPRWARAGPGRSGLTRGIAAKRGLSPCGLWYRDLPGGPGIFTPATADGAAVTVRHQVPPRRHHERQCLPDGACPCPLRPARANMRETAAPGYLQALRLRLTPWAAPASVGRRPPDLVPPPRPPALGPESLLRRSRRVCLRRLSTSAGLSPSRSWTLIIQCVNPSQYPTRRGDRRCKILLGRKTPLGDGQVPIRSLSLGDDECHCTPR